MSNFTPFCLVQTQQSGGCCEPIPVPMPQPCPQPQKPVINFFDNREYPTTNNTTNNYTTNNTTNNYYTTKNYNFTSNTTITTNIYDIPGKKNKTIKYIGSKAQSIFDKLKGQSSCCSHSSGKVNRSKYDYSPHHGRTGSIFDGGYTQRNRYASIGEAFMRFSDYES